MKAMSNALIRVHAKCGVQRGREDGEQTWESRNIDIETLLLSLGDALAKEVNVPLNICDVSGKYPLNLR